MFSSEEVALYSSQIILPKFTAKGQKLLKKSNVLLVGCGGLGSVCALYLIRAGLGKITLLDHDKVELKNLQRQILYTNKDIHQSKVKVAKKKLFLSNPYVEIQAINKKFNFLKNKDSLAVKCNYDLILDCSDNYATKKSINSYSLYYKIPAVFAAAVGWSGFFFSVFPYKSACYECFYRKPIADTPCDQEGIVGPLVGVIGCWQALEAIKILLKLKEHSFGKVYFWDGLYNKNYIINVSKKKDCSACFKK